ncbi:MAG: class I SAM-dependent methyltransferase [Desulfurivibrionaceae bacterium]|nr:class I SAM-dependent methyltransferase [Desulfurivibrionaceae bacterium]
MSPQKTTKEPMESDIDFEERYQSGNTPWEIHRPDQSLMDFIENCGLAPCRVLDIGCGTGSNLIWLASRNFQATGYDLSALAIKTARQKAAASGADCTFVQGDFLADELAANSFDFVFDRGCFHHFRDPDSRLAFAAKVAHVLSEEGIWLSLIGNRDDTREGPGPPKLSALEITSAVEPFFKIIALTAHHFDFDHTGPPALNWICQLKKRPIP